jgi:ferrochelatase
MKMFDAQSQTTERPATCPMHAQPDHPKVKPARVGILMANLGTPDGTDYWSMRRYLNEFLSDKRVVDYSAWIWQPLLQLVILTKRPFSSGAAYRSIWNEEEDESPLLTITKRQTAAIKQQLVERYGDNVRIDFCMRYGNPSTKSKVREMVDDGCAKILFFPLYPHYAGATSATANDKFFRALMEEKWQPVARVVAPYFEEPAYIDALAQSIERAYADAGEKPEKLICSYHGVPERYLREGDPYHCQCQKTTRLLKERLGWDDTQIVTTFQSLFGPEEWLKPYTVEEVARLAKEEGVKSIAICAPAFSADCIETLEEINEEIKESFEEAGGEHFTYIPCLNDDPSHIDALTGVIEKNLKGWLG